VTVNAHPCHCNHSARRSPCRATPRSSSWSSTWKQRRLSGWRSRIPCWCGRTRLLN